MIRARPGVIERRSREGSERDIHGVEESDDCSFGDPRLHESAGRDNRETRRCYDSMATSMSPWRGPGVIGARSGSVLMRVDDRRES